VNSRNGDRAALIRVLRDLVAAGATGVQLRVHDGLGDWAGSAGVAERGRPAGVSTEGRFRIGSVTKPFAAAVLLMLAGEAELRLDDPVDRYLPRFGLDRGITVRMALMHLSGLFNYSGENRSDGTTEPGVFPVAGPDYVRSLATSRRPEDLIRFALSRPVRFAPGAGFAYSNTNYLLVQLIIEKITGTSYAEQIRRRITGPLGMRDTVVPVERTDIPGPHAHGYLAYRDGDELTVVDVTESSPSWYGAAGSILSTTADLDTFLAALLGGRLLAPPLLDEMLTFVPPAPGPGVSAGLFRKDFAAGRVGIGHFGSVPGFLCFLYATPDASARMAMSVTRGAVDRNDPAAVAGFLAAVDQAVARSFADLRVPVNTP
jgi:D-alanyl-D-alanine carboxypeptidase